jgi:hypothetical protein
VRNVGPQLDFLRDPVELITLGVPQIVSNLQAQPPTGVAAEVAGEAQCRIGRDGALSSGDRQKPIMWHVERARVRGSTDSAA